MIVSSLYRLMQSKKMKNKLKLSLHYYVYTYLCIINYIYNFLKKVNINI